MTRYGLDQIINAINEMVVEPPDKYRHELLAVWVDGYGKARLDILRVLEEIRDDMETRL